MTGIVEGLRQALRSLEEQHKVPARIVLSLDANYRFEAEMSAIGCVQDTPPTRGRRFMDVPIDVRDIEAAFIVEAA